MSAKHTFASGMLATALVVAVAVPVVVASPYPTNKCVGSKLKAAAGKCKADLKAWAKWDKNQDSTTRDGTLADTAAKFDLLWQKAEDKAAANGADCVEATLSDADMRALMDAAIDALVTDVNTGLDLVGNDDDGMCGGGILNAAAGRCSSFLKAEGMYIKKIATDPQGLDRADKQAKAAAKFVTKYATATEDGCPTGASDTDIATALDTLDADIVKNATTAPNLNASSFTVITPAAGIEYEGRTFDAICSDDSPYSFFVKRGTVNKVLMYYQGGGACWDYGTCAVVGTCDKNVVTGNVSGSDNPDFTTQAGLNDRTNPDNPFKDWNVVFVSYCTCDIHWGENKQLYLGSPNKTIEHMGYVNAKVAEKWAREHFLNPSEVFVTGSSAGGYGALLHGALLHLVYPASHFNVLADASNGVTTPSFLQNNISVWHVDANIPTYIPGLDQPIGSLTLNDLVEAEAEYYPATNWAHYTTAYDGGTGGQTGFFNVMRNLGNVLQWLRWWDASCDWNDAMRQQALDLYAAVSTGNYRYYIGTGTRHTMFGSNKVYTDTTGGVPTIVDWINEMMTNGAGWVNVEATNQGLLLSGDPQPGTECVGGDNDNASCTVASQCPSGTCALAPPFEQSGPDVVVNCP